MRRVLDRSGSVPISERIQLAIRLARQVLPAVELLHSHGIVHRDLKPSNVMLGPEGIFKLIDFGVVIEVDCERALSFDCRAAGTLPYAAPEQARGEPATPASDMYSLGVLLFELTVGRLPRDGEAANLCSLLSLPGADRTCSGQPEALARLCEALLQKEYRLRPDARSALAAVADDPDFTPCKATTSRRDALAAPAPPRARICYPAPCSTTEDGVEGWLAARLETVSDGLFDALIVEGPDGSGKSSLLRRTRDSAGRLGGLVLTGRGAPEEHVEYNVLDGAIDALATLLLETPLDVELATDLALASATFPVLAGLRVSGRARSRAQAFDALIRILASLAGAAGVYLLIDDLQMADAGSLSFLTRLIERRPAGVGLIATLRGGESRVRRWADAQHDIWRHELTAPVSPPGVDQMEGPIQARTTGLNPAGQGAARDLRRPGRFPRVRDAASPTAR
jgi:Protein kinase domain/AAA ATPase domain